MKPEKASLFDNFNARHITQEEVAETFVSSTDFYDIAKNNHTFVLGPRGCGKTTMFKMLTTPALRNWHPTRKRDRELKENIPFIALYFPSDELWKDQVNNITSSVKDQPKIFSFITNALNCTNIYTNFCISLQKHISYLEVEDRRDKEIQFSNQLIKIFSLEDCPSSISAIKLELGNRRETLVEKLNSYNFYRKFDPNVKVDFEDYYFADFLNPIRNGILAFETIYNDGHELKWALCFDELELVSRDFLNAIIKKLRISPPNIVFKLSSSPLTEFEDDIAQVFHDYEVVKMWPFSHSEEPRYADLCEEIARQRILSYRKKKNIISEAVIDFDKIFGTVEYSDTALREFQFDIDPNAKDTEPRSLTWHAFRQLGILDFSFKEQMVKKGLDPNNPVPKNRLQYDGFIRKTKELVINRLIFTKYEDGKPKTLRTRKEYPLYYGKETLFRVCEGNPRFIMNIMNDMLKRTEKNAYDQDLIFTPEDQAVVIKNVSDRFNAMLNTYPTYGHFNQKPVDLEWLIEKIGSYFSVEMNMGRFKVSPANSFIFKKLTNSNVKQIARLINIGVGLGAFIKVDKNLGELSNEADTRFRLSYLLHPRFKMPLRLYSSIKLNNILARYPNNNPEINFNDGN